MRLTGGEPLTRSDLVSIIAGIKNLGIPDLSLTTNGIMLAQAAAALKSAGLDRVNVSLDSLKPHVFRRLTHSGNVEDVFLGVKAAISAGLFPVKINVVVMAGVNDGEIMDLARLSLVHPISVRFIEVMPIGPDRKDSSRSLVPMDQVKARLTHLGALEPVEEIGAGPAEVYRLGGAPGTVGFIAPLSHPFCASCNRLRVTPDGKLRPCLASDDEVDLVPALRGKDVERDLLAAFNKALLKKPERHDLQSHPVRSRRMCQIGG